MEKMFRRFSWCYLVVPPCLINAFGDPRVVLGRLLPFLYVGTFAPPLLLNNCLVTADSEFLPSRIRAKASSTARSRRYIQRLEDSSLIGCSIFAIRGDALGGEIQMTSCRAVRASVCKRLLANVSEGEIT